MSGLSWLLWSVDSIGSLSFLLTSGEVIDLAREWVEELKPDKEGQ